MIDGTCNTKIGKTILALPITMTVANSGYNQFVTRTMIQAHKPYQNCHHERKQEQTSLMFATKNESEVAVMEVKGK